ncbi:hypothetical protein Lesp02_02700 [Lentzea sp. NBRC 105346]|uniref:hypothetical protein n=1 Tax=Lentzea sp. NBRC 105346 TaxID=3032205 RepID=UPI0024A474D3|nr:hypothetical protein [Lentzea sp. NBRC 105346]GLZ28080.1 hypothetical protein Lesp02_02700 [Lentzea sp. NBRC 105346]
MNILHVLRQVRAATELRAVPRASQRHLYLAENPLVIAMYTLAGEPFAPLAFVWGTDPHSPSHAVAYEPRNRDQRYAAIHRFAEVLGDYLAPFLEVEWETNPKSRKSFPTTPAGAPQIIVPNTGTQRALCRALGRALRYRKADGPTGVSPETRWAGAHLTWLDYRTDLPGQAVVVPATQALSTHWVTGQAELEDENLAATLAWIDNDPARGLADIDKAETSAYGPHTDPDEDKHLIRLVQYRNGATSPARKAQAEKDIEAHVLPPLLQAYEATHRAIGLLRELPESPPAASRWSHDERAWAYHASRCGGDEPPRFTVHPRVDRAVADCAEAELRAQQLHVDTVYSDPLIMAELVADGTAVLGVVESVDLSHKEIKPGNVRRTQVPLITMRCQHKPILPLHSRLWWEGPDLVVAELRQVTSAADGWIVLLALQDGHNRGTRIPQPGMPTVYAALDRTAYPQPNSFGNTPWTHQPHNRDGAA